MNHKKALPDDIDKFFKGESVFFQKPEEIKTETRLLANQQSRKQENKQMSKEAIEQPSKPASLPTSNQENTPATKPENKQASKQLKKFASYLPHKLLKELKFYALSNDMEIYEVIEKAVRHYIHSQG